MSEVTREELLAGVYEQGALIADLRAALAYYAALDACACDRKCECGHCKARAVMQRALAVTPTDAAAKLRREVLEGAARHFETAFTWPGNSEVEVPAELRRMAGKKD